jgi:hypothetical protein
MGIGAARCGNVTTLQENATRQFERNDPDTIAFYSMITGVADQVVGADWTRIPQRQVPPGVLESTLSDGYDLPDPMP